MTMLPQPTDLSDKASIVNRQPRKFGSFSHKPVPECGTVFRPFIGGPRQAGTGKPPSA